MSNSTGSVISGSWPLQLIQSNIRNSFFHSVALDANGEVFPADPGIEVMIGDGGVIVFMGEPFLPTSLLDSGKRAVV